MLAVEPKCCACIGCPPEIVVKLTLVILLLALPSSPLIMIIGFRSFVLLTWSRGAVSAMDVVCRSYLISGGIIVDGASDWVLFALIELTGFS